MAWARTGICVVKLQKVFLLTMVLSHAFGFEEFARRCHLADAAHSIQKRLNSYIPKLSIARLSHSPFLKSHRHDVKNRTPEQQSSLPYAHHPRIPLSDRDDDNNSHISLPLTHYRVSTPVRIASILGIILSVLTIRLQAHYRKTTMLHAALIIPLLSLLLIKALSLFSIGLFIHNS